MGVASNSETAIITIIDSSKEQQNKTGGGSVPNLLRLKSKMLSQPAVPRQDDSMTRFTVQFNPGQLQLYGAAKTKTEKSVENDGKNQQPAQQGKAASTEAPNLQLSVQLTFDHVVNADAFSADKLLLTPGGLASTVTSAVKNAISGKEYTVQTEVEGFIAAVCNTETRRMQFQWGKFFFDGIVTDVQARYTMFNPSGRPVRGVVDLRLTQSFTPEIQKQWSAQLEKAFASGALNLTSAAQMVGSAINLPV